jgi:hypothetical protein
MRAVQKDKNKYKNNEVTRLTEGGKIISVL